MKKEAPRKGGLPPICYVQFKTAETRIISDFGNAEMMLQMR